MDGLPSIGWRGSARIVWRCMALGFLAVAASGCDASVKRVMAEHTRDGAQLLVAEAASDAPPAAVRLLIERLGQAQPVWRVGTVSGRPETQWGFVTDVASDSAGRIYVLDQMSATIRVFAGDGRYVTSMLRDGDGPLEMRQPIGLEMLPGDSLLVYSTAGARIIALTDGAGTEQVRSFTHPTPTLDLCQSGPWLFERTASPEEDGTVQRVGLDGSPEMRFGAMPDIEDGAVRAQLAMGSLECSREGDWVVTANFDGPVLRAYTRMGDSLWTSEVAEFDAPEVSVVSVGGATGVQRPGTKPSDRVLSLVALSGDALLGQVARIGSPQVVGGRRTWPIERIDSWLMSAANGGGYYLGSHLPHILHATDTLLVGLLSDVATGLIEVVAYEW